MRNQYKVLQETYELEVEARATAEEKKIYNVKALTQDFLPTAIKIYKTQIEPQIKKWPDLDIMTDPSFPYNILNNNFSPVINYAYWVEAYIYNEGTYKPRAFFQNDFPWNNLDAILERWFVYHLFYNTYSDAKHIKYNLNKPYNYYKAVRNKRIPPQKSNADFIQYLINGALAQMKQKYNRDYEDAEKKYGEGLADWKNSLELHMIEANNKEKQNNSTSMDPEEVIEQIINKATVATQNYIKLLNNKRVPGIKLAEYIRQHIQPIILEILSYIKENNPQKKARTENYLKELLTTNWLVVDRMYWDVEMDTIVRSAVEDGEAVVQDLQRLANRGNKLI